MSTSIEPRLSAPVAYWRLYRRLARTAVVNEFQYRVNTIMYLVGMVAEPTVYLVVWQSIAREQGGTVGGYTAGTFAAYYIVWTLVRNMNIVFTPFGWEWRIRDGQMSAQLVRPMHPIHYDLGFFAGSKVIWLLFWIPIAAALSLVFRPTLNPSLAQAVTFFIALWGAYLIRSMFLWLLGMITFWTTRVSAIFMLYFSAELLFSGRLVPVSLMPIWMRTVSDYLPFESTFGFPITALVGPVTNGELATGLFRQLIWIGVGTVLVAIFWPRAVKRYTAVAG